MSSARQTAVWGAQLQQVNRRELEVQTHPILASSANQALWTKNTFFQYLASFRQVSPKESEESVSASALWPYKGFYSPAVPASGFLKTGVGRSCKSLAMIEPKNGCCPSRSRGRRGHIPVCPLVAAGGPEHHPAPSHPPQLSPNSSLGTTRPM